MAGNVNNRKQEPGKSLDKAHGQVIEYFQGIPDKQLPQYILVSDFAHFRLYDLNNATTHEFTIDKLVENIGLSGFISGYQKRVYNEQDPVNIHAAELMGRLNDKLEAAVYVGHTLEKYLVKMIFLVFTDDIFILMNFANCTIILTSKQRKMERTFPPHSCNCSKR